MPPLNAEVSAVPDHPITLSTPQFEAAYQNCFHQTVNYLRARGGSREWAEEIAQAAWARGWECRAQLKDSAAVQSWVIAIARNLRNQDFRKFRSTEALTEASATINPDSRPLLLQQILRPLSQTDRALLMETYVNGATSCELGSRLGLSPVAVRVRVARAKAAVRNGLRKSRIRFPAPRVNRFA